MARRKQDLAAEQRPDPIRWEFDPAIPSDDFLSDLTKRWGLHEAISDFINWLEEGRFLTWEAVVCYEQGRSLTASQEKALNNLVSFEESNDQILYIDDIARPNEPWHVILNKIVPRLLIEPFNTAEVPSEVPLDGWLQLLTALQNHSQGLSLPEGPNSPPEVIPTELRHKLWLQYCFNSLSGVGQSDESNLPEQTWRIDEFIQRLRECKPVVECMALTLDSLFTRVILPEPDQARFVAMMQKELGLESTQDPIAEHL